MKLAHLLVASLATFALIACGEDEEETTPVASPDGCPPAARRPGSSGSCPSRIFSHCSIVVVACVVPFDYVTLCVPLAHASRWSPDPPLRPTSAGPSSRARAASSSGSHLSP